MRKKRGILIIVMLVLAVVYVPLVLGAEGDDSGDTSDEEISEFVTYDAITIMANCDDEYSACYSTKKNVNRYCDGNNKFCHYNECDTKPFGVKPGCLLYAYEIDGVIDNDGDNPDSEDDECAGAYMLPGINIDSEYKSNDERYKELGDSVFKINFYYEDKYQEALHTESTGWAVGASTGTAVGIGATMVQGFLIGGASLGPVGAIAGFIGGIITGAILSVEGINEDAEILLSAGRTKFKEDKGVLCANDHSWYQCDEDQVGVLQYVDMEREQTDKTIVKYPDMAVFECMETDNEIYEWVQGIDIDHDGYTIEDGDCQDFPNLDPVEFNCPALDYDEYQLKTKEEVRLAAKSVCNNVNYAGCAICVNSGAPEVCGDGLNNDCGGVDDEGDSYLEKYDELEGETNDDCDKFEAGCNALDTELGRNIFGESLTWRETDSGNNCCGDDPLNDFATIEESDSTNYLCVKNDPNLVGTSMEEINHCEHEWCWLGADVNAYEIYTIKKPGEQVFDIVSNEIVWRKCSAGNSGVLPYSIYSPTKSNKFSCYDEGNKWSWAECCTTNCEGKNGIKERAASQGIYSLDHFIDEENRIILRMPGSSTTSYEKIYGKDNYLDFSSYDYLDFYIEFTSEEVLMPAQIEMEIYSLNGKFFSENVMDYVINGPQFSLGKKMHVQVPVEEWEGVYLINILRHPASNKVKLSNVHLTRSDNNNLVCSGEVSSQTSSWLSDIDGVNDEFTGQDACESFGLTWLGDEVPEEYRCCGDDAGEYYLADTGTCWNSQVLESGSTITDVEVEIEYGQGAWNFDYPTEVFDATLEISHLECPTNNLEYGDVAPGAFSALGNPNNAIEMLKGCIAYSTGLDYCDGQKYYSPGIDCLKLNEVGNFPVLYKNMGCDTLQPLVNSIVTKVHCNTEKIEEITLTDLSVSGVVPTFVSNISFMSDFFYKASVKSSNPEVDVSFVNLDDASSKYTELKQSDLNSIKNEFFIVAETNKISRDYTYESGKKEVLTFSCSLDTCQMPLKGSPPYTIKNLHPENYDLYYLNGDSKLLINGERKIYSSGGWLQVENVPQQVLYNGESLFGCGYGNSTKIEIEDSKMCGTQTGYFCSFGSWSNEELPKMVYDEDNVLVTSSETILPEDRNWSSSIVPGRNILFNPWLGK
jgi:hypothetical protein